MIEPQTIESPTDEAASEYETVKLPFITKLAYGSGDLGTAITAALRAFFLLFFLTDVARMDPRAAGGILLINRVWDAINDPVIGWLSDRTRTRWGRRRPWILFGAIPFGILFFLLWLVPPFESTGKFIYYLVVALLLDTAFSVVNVPYAALTPDLTDDYDERTSLNSYRFAFSVGGALVSAVLHPIIVQQFDSVRTGYAVSGLIWAIISTIPCFIVFAATKERFADEAPDQSEAIPPLQQVRIAFANRPYRFVIGLYLFSWLALQLVSTVLVFYMTYYIKDPGGIPMLLLAVQGSAFIFLFVWGQVSKRLDKRAVYMLGASLWLVVMIAFYFVTPETSYLVLPFGALAGAGVAVAYLIPWAMMPDVIEFDEWETGQRREGVFYGFMVFLQKTGIAVGIFLVSQMLAAAGYITPTDAVPIPDQPDSALQALRIFIGPVPAFLIACSIVLVYFYPITRDLHEKMLTALANRRAAENTAGAAAD